MMYNMKETEKVLCPVRMHWKTAAGLNLACCFNSTSSPAFPVQPALISLIYPAEQVATSRIIL